MDRRTLCSNKKMKKEKYDFNICSECQKRNVDVPCDKGCIYLNEKLKNGKRK